MFTSLLIAPPDDDSVAFWLVHLLRLGILPTGYICPKPTRSERDLLRKRGQLVRQRTSHILSIHNLYARNTGSRLSNQAVKQLTKEQVQDQSEDLNLVLAIESNRSIKYRLIRPSLGPQRVGSISLNVIDAKQKGAK